MTHLAALMEIPTEFLDGRGCQASREFFFAGALKGGCGFFEMHWHEQTDRPSRKRPEQRSMPVQKDAKVCWRGFVDAIQENMCPTVRAHTNWQLVWKVPDGPRGAALKDQLRHLLTIERGGDA